MFRVTPLKVNAKTIATLKGLTPARIDRGMKLISHRMAVELLSELREAAKRAGPVQSDLIAHAVIKETDEGYGVFIEARQRFAKSSESKDTLLYVRATREGAKDRAVQILETMSPWTIDTLPYEPKARMVDVEARRSPTMDVAAVKKKQTESRQETEAALRKAGIAMFRSANAPLTLQVKEDVNLLAQRAEIGILEGALPIWGPAIRATKASARSLLPEMARLVFEAEPSPPNVGVATPEDEKGADAFQKRVRS